MNISTKTSTEVTETIIKEVSTELNINKKHVKTHVKLDMDGKTILDEDGHSILANFGRYMEFLMWVGQLLLQSRLLLSVEWVLCQEVREQANLL